MYGYHAEEQAFLKIFLYSPNMVKRSVFLNFPNPSGLQLNLRLSPPHRVADLLLGGAVMNKMFQPHEAHIPYPLQVMSCLLLSPVPPVDELLASLQVFIDYNLYGMNLLHAAAVKFRRPDDCELVYTFPSFPQQS